MSGPGTLDGIINKLNRDMGPGTIVRGRELVNRRVERITTGSLVLDVALGGGWPVNHWHEIIGEATHGKTALALQTIAANQRLDPEWNVWWLAAEHFAPDYAELCGCDLSRIIVHDTNITQDGFSAILQVAATREVDAIVIDSLPALVPNEEDDNDTGDWSVGLAARLNNQFFRKQGTATKRSLVAVERPVTGFIINQWREKIGVMRGDPRVAPGGRQKDYEYYTRVEVRRDDWIKVDDEPVGQVTKIRVWKNKSHRPQRTAVFDMYFAEGAEGHPAGRIDHIKEVVDIGIAYDIIRQGGGGMFYIGDRSWKGRAAVAESLRSEDDLRELVVRDVMAINAHYTELVSPPPAKKAVKAVKATKKSA